MQQDDLGSDRTQLNGPVARDSQRCLCGIISAHESAAHACLLTQSSHRLHYLVCCEIVRIDLFHCVALYDFPEAPSIFYMQRGWFLTL